MTNTSCIMDFQDLFKKTTGNLPFPYQCRLATEVALSQLIDAPTGAGKTAAVVLAWLFRRRFSDDATRLTTPRRLVYCLPMRVLVEQTVGVAKEWLRNLELHNDIGVHTLMGGED